MTTLTIANNTESLVTDNPLSNVATTVNISTGAGANFPATYPYRLTIWDEGSYSDPSDDPNMEVVECTGKTADALEILRAKENTLAVVHAYDSAIALLITAGIFNDGDYGILTHLNNIEEYADVTDATNIATSIENVTSKTTPVDTDEIPLLDSIVSYALKNTSWSNIKSTLKTYFDTLYSSLSDFTTHITTTTGIHGVGASTIASQDYVNLRIPSGLISMWNGTITTIPSGWYLCDGNNGTPDLRSRFIRGAPIGVDPGATGGADTHTLSENEMPSHTHHVTAWHNGSYTDRWGLGGSTTGIGSKYTDATGGNAAHNNMPAYYQVLFIMKS